MMRFLLKNTLLPIPPPRPAASRKQHPACAQNRRLGRSTPCGVPAEGARSKRKTSRHASHASAQAPVLHQPRCASSPSSSSAAARAQPPGRAHEAEWAEVTLELRVIVPISVKILLLQYIQKFMRTARTSSEKSLDRLSWPRAEASGCPKLSKVCLLPRSFALRSACSRGNRCARLWPLLPGCHFASAPIPRR